MRNMFAPPAGILGDQEEAVRQQMQMQGLLGLAAGLFQAGTPSRTPQSLGGSALQGLMAGQQMAQGTFDQTLKAMQLRQQMADAAEKRKREQQFREAVSGAYVERPVAGLGIGPDQLAFMQPEIEAFGAEGIAPAATTVAPKERVIDRDRLLSAIAEFAPEKYLELTQPEKAAETFRPLTAQEAASVGLPTGTQFQISSTGKISQIGQAPGTVVNVGGEKKLTEVLGTKTAERLDASLTQAQEAQSTLQNVAELRPIIAQGVFSGPLSGAPRAITQIASSLGITGKDTNELLQRTAVAMQGLAKFELSAAAAMRGQGAITENERMLIQRAAAGRLDQFTSTEVQALLDAMEKTAKFRISSHNKQLDVLRKNPSDEVRSMIPFYEIQPFNIAPTQQPSLPQGVSVRKK